MWISSLFILLFRFHSMEFYSLSSSFLIFCSFFLYLAWGWILQRILLNKTKPAPDRKTNCLVIFRFYQAHDARFCIGFHADLMRNFFLFVCAVFGQEIVFMLLLLPCLLFREPDFSSKFMISVLRFFLYIYILTAFRSLEEFIFFFSLKCFRWANKFRFEFIYYFFFYSVCSIKMLFSIWIEANYTQFLLIIRLWFVCI